MQHKGCAIRMFSKSTHVASRTERGDQRCISNAGKHRRSFGLPRGTDWRTSRYIRLGRLRVIGVITSPADTLSSILLHCSSTLILYLRQQSQSPCGPHPRLLPSSFGLTLFSSPALPSTPLKPPSSSPGNPAPRSTSSAPVRRPSRQAMALLVKSSTSSCRPSLAPRPRPSTTLPAVARPAAVVFNMEIQPGKAPRLLPMLSTAFIRGARTLSLCWLAILR